MIGRTYPIKYLRQIELKYSFNLKNEYSIFMANQNVEFVAAFENYCKEIEAITNVSRSLFLYKCRKGNVILIRQLLIYICLKNHPVTLITIAHFVGGLNHATIIHSRNQVEDYLFTKDKQFMAVYNALKHLLNDK